jgi:hypothetical protein
VNQSTILVQVSRLRVITGKKTIADHRVWRHRPLQGS